MSDDYEKKYTEPALRRELKEKIQAGDKGGKPGQWSARKAQLLKHEYEEQGGGYKGEKSESQRHLSEWSGEDWQTQEGDVRARQADGTTRRYLPKKAWEQLTDEEKQATEAKKRQGSRGGKQFVANTPEAKKAGREARNSPGEGGRTKQKLLAEARELDIPGRSRMNKEQLAAALAKARK